MACPVPCRWECWSTIKAHSTKKALDGDFSSYSITFMRALSTLSPIARKSKDSNSELAGIVRFPNVSTGLYIHSSLIGTGVGIPELVDAALSVGLSISPPINSGRSAKGFILGGIGGKS
jgi:hypothetical protein